MRWKFGLLLTGSLALAGCGKATHLVYVHNATLGVELTPATGQGTSKFALGYDRETYALVPRYSQNRAFAACPDANGCSNGTDTDPNHTEAMTLTAISRVYVQGLNRIYFGHMIAAGKPAISVAKDPTALREAAEKVFYTPPPTPPSKASETQGNR